MSKEKPIIFSTNMVKAILDGRKTVTRRVGGLEEINKDPDRWKFSRYFYNPTEALFEDLHDTIEKQQAELRGTKVKFAKPRYQKGDLLWVKEAWRIISWREGEAFGVEYKDGTKIYDLGGDDYDDQYEKLILQSCEDCVKSGIEPDEYGVYSWPGEQSAPTRWHLSIHMFKWMARIWLEVLDVRAERLQEITEEDAIKEGIDTEGCCVCPPEKSKGVRFCLNCNERLWDLVGEFEELWDSLNTKRGYGWDVNPWVWRCEFKVK